MNLAVLVLAFVIGFAVALTRGTGFALSTVYLPALLLLSSVTPFYFSVLSRIDAPAAALYGILVATLFSGHAPRFRPTLIDALVLALLGIHFASTLQTEPLLSGVRTLFIVGNEEGIFAYFVARSWFRGPAATQGALAALAVVVAVVAPFALIEARLWPHTYDLLMESVGLIESVDLMTLGRLGFFRAEASFAHPIDLGNGAALSATLYAMLVWYRGQELFRGIRPAVLGGWLFASLCAISFSSFAGVASGALIFAALLTFRFSRKILPLLTVLIIAAGFIAAERIANAPQLWEKRGETPLEASYRNRQELLKQSLDVARTAGALGWGARLEREGRVTRSVDNAHLLTAMRRGWLGLGVWLAIPLALSVTASRLRGNPRNDPDLRAVLLATGAVLGTTISMFTVFFGFVYAQLFMFVLGFAVTQAQAVRRAAAPRQRRPRSVTAAAPAAPGAVRR